jgi:hypothetical protein
MDAVARTGDMTREPYIQQALAESRTTKRAAVATLTPTPSTARVATSIVHSTSHLPNKLIGKAIDEWGSGYQIRDASEDPRHQADGGGRLRQGVRGAEFVTAGDGILLALGDCKHLP